MASVSPECKQSCRVIDTHTYIYIIHRHLYISPNACPYGSIMFMLLRSQAYWFQIHSSPFLLYWVSGELATAVYQVSRSSDSVSVGSLGPDVDKVLFEPSKHLWQVWGLILNAIFPLLPSCWGFSFALGCGVSLFHGIQHSPINGYSAVSYNFWVLTGEDEHMSSYSTILCLSQTCVWVSCRGMGQQ